MLKIGIDIGGTFTDFVFFDKGQVWTHKVFSTPKNPAIGVLQGLREAIGLDGGFEIVHGSTVATNALLERKGAKVALITTKGFEDVLEIGRQERMKLYDLFIDRPSPLVPSNLRFGVSERIDYKGKVLTPLDEEGVMKALEGISREKVESIAICLLFSYANPGHEERVMSLARGLDLPVSVSHRVLPEYREYERCATTVVNAYVSPLMEGYLEHLEKAIGRGKLRIMQSNGGSISAATARHEAVHTILSGPAAGVVGGVHIGRMAGYRNVITFDMGGTSTDVSLCEGEIKTTPEFSIGGCPIRVPVIDIHTVGSGGGSLVYLDEGGALRVGPQSAGANPGPVCYGKGEGITVTDANLVLGRIDPAHFLGGRMPLDVDRAHRAMEDFGRRVGIPTLQLVEGIVTVANSTMEKAIRVISVERGFDPREFSLVSFGGAGGLHACDLARALSIPRVIIPLNAGLLSAYGMLISDIIKDYSYSALIPTLRTSFRGLKQAFQPLIERGRLEMLEEGIPEERVSYHLSMDMRYVGQSYEIPVPFQHDYEAKFHVLHRRAYGYSSPGKATEVVNLRLRVIGETEKPSLPEVEDSDDSKMALLGEKEVYYKGDWLRVKIFDRQGLKATNTLLGPAIVVEPSATTFLPPGYHGVIDKYGNIIIGPSS